MKRAFPLLLLLYIIIAIVTIIFCTGTGDSGDSISHYLYAKYAPRHPALFFNHWAKPLFVLLASPFAQFGFTGMKTFNALASLLTIIITYCIAVRLQIKNAIVIVVILIFTPLYYILTFSGLTEPLFALGTAAGIYMAVKEKHLASAVIVSFLPFIRSEGLIIAGVFTLYFIYKKQWKVSLWLLCGSFVYSIAGYFVYHDFLWVFNEIPYARMSSTYGHGKPFDFVIGLMYVVGVPIYILIWIGVFCLMIPAIKRKTKAETHILILTGFFALLIGHSLFWYFGIFNSMGLKRVMLCMMPMSAIIALKGFNFITEDLIRKEKIKRTMQSLLIVYIIVFPFSSNPAAIKWKRDMMLSTDQQLARKAADFILKNKGAEYIIVTTHPYIAEVMNIDFFDESRRRELNRQNISLMRPGDILIWENWLSVVERGITKESLDADTTLTSIFNAKDLDRNREIVYAVYQKKF
jgi:hypothetical protein